MVEAVSILKARNVGFGGGPTPPDLGGSCFSIRLDNLGHLTSGGFFVEPNLRVLILCNEKKTCAMTGGMFLKTLSVDVFFWLLRHHKTNELHGARHSKRENPVFSATTQLSVHGLGKSPHDHTMSR